MKRLVILCALSLAACGGDEEEQATTEAAGAVVEGNRVRLQPGFMPDPATLQVQAGGERTLDGPGCIGTASNDPTATLEVTADVSNLRVAAWPTAGEVAEHDLSLAIQKPDGSWSCNDDHEDLAPMVEGSFPAGTYRVWVGLLGDGQVPSRLGFSELGTFTPRSLASN